MERLSGLAFAGLIRALGLLSLTWQRRLGRLLGSLAWRLGGYSARITRINLERCFPELDAPARGRIGRLSLQHAAMLLTEMGTLYHWPVEDWRRLATSIEGEDLLRGRPDDDRGVLILVPHFGNWEFLALVLGQYAVTALYDPPRQAALEPLIRGARSRAGANMLPIDAAGLRGFYHALRSGAVTALLPDQVPERRGGVYAPFFGWPVLTMTFAHRLLRRCDARVVFGAALRCEGGFDVRFSEADAAIGDPDPVVSATAMNAAIESLIRTDPAQYQWEYKRFKRPPPGTPTPYPRR
ncbi:MAG: lysophospholipid acyltransferase family protein [Pseudomonadales bacterium]